MNFIQRAGLLLSSLYLRRTSYTFGRWRIINYFLPLLRKKGKELGERTIRTKYGFYFNTDLGDWLGQYIYLTGTYEPPTAKIIADILSPGDTFIDIGANAGFFTLLASSKVGDSGNVIAFEPVPSMKKRITDNISLNSMNNITIHSTAVSNKHGVLPLFEGPVGHKGISSLRPINDASATLQVTTAPLDSFIDSFTSVKLIKIDVEGAEQLAVEGMQGIIKEFHPFLIIEITDKYLRSFGHDAITLTRKLIETGYTMYAIRPEGLEEISPEQATDEDQFNAFFAPENMHQNLLSK